jgi:CRP-like cAMP-binding protein
VFAGIVPDGSSAVPVAVAAFAWKSVVHVMSEKSPFSSKTFEANHVIFDERHAAEAIYVIKSGSVEIRIGTLGDNPQVLGPLQKGDVFGELALIENRSHQAAAVTLEETTVVEIPRDEFLKRLTSLDPVMKTVVMHLVARLREMTAKYGKRRDLMWEGWERKD